jgi:hypothetical protein
MLSTVGVNMTTDQKAKRAAYMYAYRRRKAGRELGNPGRAANTPDVLWSKVDIKSHEECWPWKGCLTEDGYGRTWINDKGYYAHRVIFNLTNPNIIELSSPTNKKAKGFLMHICDNRMCCNPSHLKVADLKENNQDCINKKRRIMPKGENHHRSVFTDSEISLALDMRKSGQTAAQIAVALNKNKATIKSLLYRRRYA